MSQARLSRLAAISTISRAKPRCCQGQAYSMYRSTNSRGPSFSSAMASFRRSSSDAYTAARSQKKGNRNIHKRGSLGWQLYQQLQVQGPIAARGAGIFIVQVHEAGPFFALLRHPVTAHHLVPALQREVAPESSHVQAQDHIPASNGR